MKARYVILGIILLSLAVKIHPPLTHDFLVDFDSIYHTRIGQTVARTGWVPSRDFVAGGRPHLYPPGYHLLLGYASIMTGIEVFDLIQYALPLVSALLALTAYFLIKKWRDEEAALWGAAFMAFSPIVTSQSYDSPHLFGLLLFPLIVYFFLKGRYLPAGGLFALTLLFNYGIALSIGVVLLAFSLWKLSRGDKNFLVYALLIAAIGGGLMSPWLLMSASRAGECLDISTAVVSVNDPGTSYLWVMAPFIAAIGFGLFYLVRKSRDDYAVLWRIALGISVVAFLVSLFIPELHPYDQILLFGFSMPFLLTELRIKREYKLAIVIISIVGMLLSVMAVEPALSEGDVAGAEWIDENVESGVVLANLEVSGTINMLAMRPGIQTSFDQFLECIPDRERWVDLHTALKTADGQEALMLMEKHGVDYVVVGERDVEHYGFDIQKFKELGLETVFQSGGTKVYKT